MEPKIIEGGMGLDDRGTVAFVNNFNFEGVKRFYCVENFELSTIRAFHGHEKEAKYVFVPRGSILLAMVKMDSKTNPSKSNPVQRVVMSERKSQIVFIPPGYANGFRALEPNTKVIFFSTSTLDESKGDDYRFPADYWGKQVWEVEHR